MFNAEQMQKLLWGQFTREANGLPPEVKAALRNLEISIVKDAGQLRLIAREIIPGNPNSQKAADVLFTQLISPISKITGAFQCQVTIFE